MQDCNPEHGIVLTAPRTRAEGEIEMKLKETITKYCKAKGWTLATLSRKCDIPAQTLHGWTTGRKAVNLEHLARVADSLEVPLYNLVYGKPDPHGTDSEIILKELFSGDVRVTLHRIEKLKRNLK